MTGFSGSGYSTHIRSLISSVSTALGNPVTLPLDLKHILNKSPFILQQLSLSHLISCLGPLWCLPNSAVLQVL